MALRSESVPSENYSQNFCPPSPGASQGLHLNTDLGHLHVPSGRRNSKLSAANLIKPESHSQVTFDLGKASPVQSSFAR